MSFASPPVECGDHSLVEILAAVEVANRQTPMTGVVAEHLTDQFVRSTCNIEQASTWFPRTCPARKDAPRTLAALRTTIIGDVLALARAAATGPEIRVSTQWVLLRGVAETIRVGGDPRALAFALGADGSSYSRCTRSVLRLKFEMASQDAKRVREVGRLLAVAAAAVHAGGRVDGSGFAATEAELRDLFEAVSTATQLSREAWPEDPVVVAAHAGRLMLALATSLDAASVIVESGPALAPAVRELSAALAAGDIVAAARAQLASAKRTLQLPERVVSAASRGLALANANDLDDAREILRRAVLPMWDERFLFDINAGLPRLESGRFRFAGDTLFGFQGGAWGVVVRGGAGYYDTVDDEFMQETIRGGGDVEAWWVSGATATWRVELRAEVEGGVYDTSTIDLRDSATSILAEETSVVARGNMMIAARYEPPARVAALLSAGAGGQFENYYAVDVDQAGDGFGAVDNDSGSATGEARLRVQVQIVPKWIVGRARLDVRYLRLSRLRRSLFAGSGAVETGSSTSRGHQVEAITRVFLDFEALRFGGFVPTLHGGLDMFHLHLPGGAASTATVWLFGAGVRRVAF